MKNDVDNSEEIKKIADFINTTNKVQNRNMVSNISTSIRRDEFDRPLRRPTTPMTNLSSTSNSQVFVVERKSIASKIRPNIPRTTSIVNQNNEMNDIKDLESDLKDRIHIEEEQKVLLYIIHIGC